MDKIGFGTLNSIVLAVYLIAMLVQVYISLKKRVESTDEFFKAGGNIPSWQQDSQFMQQHYQPLHLWLHRKKHSMETGHMQQGTSQLSRLFRY